MDYVLNRSAFRNRSQSRIVGPRSKNLRIGGGRKDSPGWTEQKRRSNRRRFDVLRPFIKTGVTICFPREATSEQLIRINASSRSFCKEKVIPARAVWEGPNRHQHLALGVVHSIELELKWISRLKKQWLKIFKKEMPPKAFFWRPDINPMKIASYLSKTRANGRVVKTQWSWLTFNPVWEVGFQTLVKSGKTKKMQYSSEKKE